MSRTASSIAFCASLIALPCARLNEIVAAGTALVIDAERRVPSARSRSRERNHRLDRGRDGRAGRGAGMAAGGERVVADCALSPPRCSPPCSSPPSRRNWRRSRWSIGFPSVGAGVEAQTLRIHEGSCNSAARPPDDVIVSAT